MGEGRRGQEKVREGEGALLLRMRKWGGKGVRGEGKGGKRKTGVEGDAQGLFDTPCSKF